jgi:hypothetical protein
MGQTLEDYAKYGAGFWQKRGNHGEHYLFPKMNILFKVRERNAFASGPENLFGFSISDFDRSMYCSGIC